jgi:hypothetical protein
MWLSPGCLKSVDFMHEITIARMACIAEEERVAAIYPSNNDNDLEWKERPYA